MQRIRERHGNVHLARQFEHSANDGINFHRAAQLQVLMHRHLHRANRLGDLEPPLNRYQVADAVSIGHDGHFLHHRAHKPDQRRVGTNGIHARARQRGNRIERGVADQLHPQIVTDALTHLGLQPGREQSLGQRVQPARQAAIGLADNEQFLAIPADLARCGDFARRMHHAADDAVRIKRAQHRATGVKRVHRRAVETAALAEEIPPRHAVDGRHHHAFGFDQGGQARQHRRYLVCLQRDEQDFLLARIGRQRSRVFVRIDAHGDAALFGDQREAVFTNRRQMRTARDHTGFKPGVRKARRQHAANRTCTDDTHFHA